MKILLVEDDDRIAAALIEALTDHHYVVDVASDGEQGFEFVQTFPLLIHSRIISFIKHLAKVNCISY